MKLFLVVGLLYLCQSVRAQAIAFGSCPNPSVLSNFQTNSYTGVWYENRKYFALFELGQSCINATYTANSDGTVGVFNQGKDIFGQLVSVRGSARLLSPPSAKLGVTFSGIPFAPSDAPYWVLDTDYTSYSVVYSCTSLGFFHTKIVWILTRQQNPDASVINKALGVLDLNSISRTPLRATKQTNCS